MSSVVPAPPPPPPGAAPPHLDETQAPSISSRDSLVPNSRSAPMLSNKVYPEKEKENRPSSPASPTSSVSSVGATAAPSLLKSSEVDDYSRAEKLSKLAMQLSFSADMQFLFALLGIVMMIIQQEVAWYANTSGGSFPLCTDSDPSWCDPREEGKMFPVRNSLLLINIIRALTTGLTIVLVLLQYEYYNTVIKVLVLRSLLPNDATLLRSYLFYPFMFELFVNCIHPFPGIDDVSRSDPTFLVFCSVFMFLRLGLVCRVIKYRSQLNSSNGRFISSLTNVEYTSLFAVKTEIRKQPWLFTVCSLLMILVS